MMTHKIFNRATLCAGAAPMALSLALLAGAPAFAQTAAPTDTNQPAVTGTTQTATSAEGANTNTDANAEVIVTGSRIARPNLSSPSPITTVDAKQFDLTGTVTPETLLNQLPQLIPGNTRVSNNQGGEPFSTLDLRGLGPNRTLILVNGERVTPSSTDGTVDISSIPTGLIQRVDVVTGGASAVYGSDAIAGVVNFVLRDNFTGMSLSTQYGVSQQGDGAEFNIEGIIGGNFADNRGNLTAYASYYTRDGVGQGDRNFSANAGVLVLGADGKAHTLTNPADFDPSTMAVLSAGGSATPPWGVVNNDASNPFTIPFASVDADCDAITANTALSGGRSLSFDANNHVVPNFSYGQPGIGAKCSFPIRSTGSSRYNFNPDNLLVVPYKHYQFAVVGHYDVTDNITFRLLSTFNHEQQTVNLAPTPATGIVVPYNSPDIPADLAAELASRPNPTAPFTMSRRFSETGPRIGIFNADDYMIRGTLEGKIVGDWKWDVTASYGQNDILQQANGNINVTAVTDGLNGCPTGSLPGCVPINIFGSNTLTPAMLNFVRIDTKEQDTLREVNVVGNITGSLFQLPGGPLGVNIGAEYRKDDGSTIVDDAQRTGNIYGFNAVQSVAGQVNVKEVYGELHAPILADMPFVHDLSVDAGIRYSDYNISGKLTNYKAGAEYAPLSWVRFRGIYNKAARAPNVFDLFQNGDQGFSAYTDPCNDTIDPKTGLSTRAAAVTARCQAAAPAVNFSGFEQENSQAQEFAFGTPGLKPERAETYTFGTVLSPSHLPWDLGSATLTVDYYHIKVKDNIAAFGAETYISNCYNEGDAASCARIVRDPGTGQITSVSTGKLNSGSLVTSGIDVEGTWLVPLSRFAPSVGGHLRIDEVLNWTHKYVSGGYNYAGLAEGDIDDDIPKYKSTLTVAYEGDRTTVQLRWNYSSGMEEDIFGRGDPGNPKEPALSYYDLSVNQKIGDHFEITGIVQDLTNVEPRIDAVGFFVQANSDTTTYSPVILGRTFRIAAKVRF